RMIVTIAFFIHKAPCSECTVQYFLQMIVHLLTQQIIFQSLFTFAIASSAPIIFAAALRSCMTRACYKRDRISGLFSRKP
ncbi:MAG TPA: hypothetical protein VFB79_08610, partial [Candidatus Angelobacter sp.]|nr:hypothetical protein [Candidatus Angelobacter sp.]